MIQVEYLNDGTLVKHYSDKGVMLIQEETGIMYSDPVDVVPCVYTYTETDKPIEMDKLLETEELIEVVEVEE